MRLKARLRQTDRATNSARGTPSKTRRDFFPRRTARRTPARERGRERGCTKLRCRRLPSRACSLADRAPQPSANKEQRLRIYESKNFRNPLPQRVVDLARTPRRRESELLDLVTPRAKQRQKPVGPAHVSRPDNNKVGLAAAQITLDFWNPVLIAR